jgi:peroxiredoxin
VDWPKLRKWVAESDISDPLNLQTKARSVRVLNSLKSTSAGVCFVLVQTYNRRARYNKLT